MNNYQSDMAGLQRLKLIGRDKVLDDILKNRRYSGRTVLYLEGEGGIGKTAVEEEVRRRIQEDSRNIIASPIIDLYHFENRTIMGLARALASILPEHSAYKKNFDKHWETTQEANRQARSEEAQKAWGDAEATLKNGLKNLSDSKKNIWIFLDTLEILIDTESSRASIGDIDNPLEQTGLAILQWLTDLFVGLSGVVIMMSGRPRSQYTPPGTFKSDRDEPSKYWKVIGPIQLKPLTERECKAYLNAIADRSKYPEAGENIKKYLRSYGSGPLYTLTDGKPLRLAVVADILTINGSLPSEAYQRGDSKEADEHALDRSMLAHLMAVDSVEADIIAQMAYLRKGADAKLLSLLTGIDEREIEGILKKLRDLAIVKYREGENRRQYFLHDEIYRLFGIYYPLEGPRKIRVSKLILTYYDDESEHWDEAMKNPNAIVFLREKKINSQIERTHYQLWFYPYKGYADYFVQASDALRDTYVDTLLLSELLHTRESMSELPGNDLVDFSRYVDWDMHLREIERISNKDAIEALRLLNQLEAKRTDMPTLLQGYWWLIHARSSIRSDNPDDKANIESSLDKALVCQKDNCPADLERMSNALKAFVQNYRGYHSRLQGNYQAAVDQYEEAAVLIRRHGLGGLIGILTNQTYAMVMLGKEIRARQISEEVIQLARESNNVYDLIRILNVRAILEERFGDPDKGLVYANRALEYLKQYADNRLEGLVRTTMARAYRHRWNQYLGDSFWNERIEWITLLPEALIHLEGTTMVDEKLPGIELNYINKGAIELLKHTTDDEAHIAAYSEAGCLWREVAWIYKKKDRTTQAKEDAYKNAKMMAETRFRKASGITSVNRSEIDLQSQIKDQIKLLNDNPFYPTLALANLGWHYHYQYIDGEYDEIIEKICRVIKGVVGDDYLWSDLQGPRKDAEKEDTNVLLWTVLGKMEMLQSYQALRGWHDNADDVLTAARHAAIALEYNYLIGKASYDLRRAEEGLERRITQSHDWEHDLLPKFYRASIALSDEIKPPYTAIGGKLRLLKWLEERFGRSDLWIDA